ncbi:MAG: DNA-directed RNA polymerase subunit alpha [Mycoplasma sp.]
MEKFLKYKIEIDTEKTTDTYAKMVIKPLERGFGNTLGNALRRVCLSSIPGASMFAIRIPGVTHEYQSIDGILEDVTQIVLNLKKLVVQIDENILSSEELENTTIEKWPVLKIDVNKAGEVYGSDIEVPAGFKIINKDLHIATLTKDIEFKVEIFAKNGRGFKTFKENKEGLSLSIIPTDSDFCPVTKFAYSVEEVKASKTNVNDELTIEVSTNGSITSSYAIALASKILVEHFNILSSLEEYVQDIQIMKEKEADAKKANLSISIEELSLSVRAYNALKQIQINTTQELIEKTRREIEGIRNLGKKSVHEIIKSIHDRGLKLKDE